MNNKDNLNISEVIYVLSEIDWFRIIRPIFSYYIAFKVLNNIRVNQDYKPKTIDDILDAPNITKETLFINEAKILSKKFGYTILDFTKTITTQLPESNLTLFYNNINSLITKKSSFHISNLITGTDKIAQYESESNKITIHSNCIPSMYHELFHMASAITKEKIIYSGFKQSTKNSALGYGLNEGYTQLLTERYFNHIENLPKTYIVEVYFAENLEQIVGKEEMERLYFSANLPGLIEKLKEYNSIENIMKFLSAYDFFSKYGYKNNLTKKQLSKTKKSLEILIAFLLETYEQKIIIEASNDPILTNQISSKLFAYTMNLRFNFLDYARKKIK